MLLIRSFIFGIVAALILVGLPIVSDMFRSGKGPNFDGWGFLGPLYALAIIGVSLILGVISQILFGGLGIKKRSEIGVFILILLAIFSFFYFYVWGHFPILVR